MGCRLSILKKKLKFIVFFFKIKRFEKLETDEERWKVAKDIYDHFIMKELLSSSHVSLIKFLMCIHVFVFFISFDWFIRLFLDVLKENARIRADVLVQVQPEHEQKSAADEFVRALQERDNRFVERPFVWEVRREREVHALLSMEELRTQHPTHHERL